MATRPVSLAAPDALAPAVAAAALLSAALVGGLVALSAPLGIAALIALCYAPLALVNLRLGIALWLPLLFLEGLPAFNAGGKAAGLLVAAAWIGGGRAWLAELGGLIARHRALFTTLALYLLWITISLVWATSAGSAASDVWRWYVVALIFVVIATSARSVDTVRLMLSFFIAGAVLSAAIGAFYGGLGGSSGLDLAAEASGRLYGAAGDPNVLAAGLIPAAVLAAGLAASTRSVPTRIWLGAAIAVLAVAVVASQSRGGFLAAIVTVLAALVFFRRRRAYVLMIVLLIVGAAATSILSSPGTWERLTTFDDGSGRTDIWRVALRVGGDQPLLGAGLNNFQEVSYRYVRQGGAIEEVGLIVDRPHVAHNMYLETYANTGIIGLGLLVGFMVACLRWAWVAGRRFERQGEAGLEALSRAVLVAGIGFLAAATFISAGVDKRLWVILAFGPVMYRLSLLTERERAPAAR